VEKGETVIQVDIILKIGELTIGPCFHQPLGVLDSLLVAAGWYLVAKTINIEHGKVIGREEKVTQGEMRSSLPVPGGAL